MKKLIMSVAVVCATAFAQAATVGWSSAGMGAYAGSTYDVFVIGQNGVESIDTVTALLDAGSSVDSYVFGSGTITAAGAGNVAASASGKTLDAGTYTSFMVLFDSASPVAGESKYVVLSGASGQTKTISASTTTVTFAGGTFANTVNNTSNWTSYGSAVPEPTSGLLLLLGMAGLALKRKVA